MVNTIKVFVVLALFVVAHTMDYNASVVNASVIAEAKERIRSYAYPALPPHLRCAKVNRAGEWLRLESAHQPDGGHWSIQCVYA